MAWALQTGVYSMQEIADYFGVHYSTVRRAVRRLEAGGSSEPDVPAKLQNA
jgi:transposase